MKLKNSIKNPTALYMVLMAVIFLLDSSANLAWAQREYWDNKSRATSQNLSSNALNHLKKMTVGKKRRWSRKKQDELIQAIQILERAIVTDPTDPLPHYLLGIALCIDGKYEKALPALQKANKLDPSEDEILLAAGLAQHLTGNYQKSFSIWSKLLKRTKRKAPVYVCIGHAQMRAGALEEALDSFSKAQNLDPSLQSAHEGMALVYFLAGDLEKAKSSFNHAQTVGFYPPICLHLAEISYLEGDIVNAKKHLQRWKKSTRKFKPNKSMTEFGFSKQHDFYWDPFVLDRFDSYNAILARQLARLKPKSAKRFANNKKLRAKLSKLQSRIANSQDDFFLFHEQALLKLAMQDQKGSIELFSKAIKQCPDNRIDLIYLAMASKQLGDSTPAWNYLAKYRAIYPKSILNNHLSSIKPVEQKASPVKTREAKTNTSSGARKTIKKQPRRTPSRRQIESDPF